MTVLELKGVGISLSGLRPISGLDLSLGEGAALAIVGRARSGKTPLARLIAGTLPAGARIDGDVKRPKRVAILGADAGLADLEPALRAGVDLLIGDEPGRARDPATQHALLAAMQVASRSRGIGLLIFTRDFRLPLVMRLETAILSGGKIVERGTAAYLMDRPTHSATRDLAGTNKTRTRTMARPPIGEPLLELRSVTKRFDGPLARWWQQAATPAALENLSFTVRRGEAVGLLGGAGAGKSLLLSLVAGLGRTSAGQIDFERHSYRGANLPRDARKRIAFLFPDPYAAFNPDLAVGLTLTEPMRVEEQLLIEEQADRLVEVVRVVGLEPDILGRLPRDFTPFELQRLALARALVGRPSFIILDEPTARLDPLEQAEFLVLFNRVRADYGLTVFCASREFEVLRGFADRILVLERGHIVEGGKPGELRHAAQHAATRALLAARYPEPPPPMPPQPVAEPEPGAVVASSVELAVEVASEPEPQPTVASEPAPVSAPVAELNPAFRTFARTFLVPSHEPVAEAPPEPAISSEVAPVAAPEPQPELPNEVSPSPEPLPKAPPEVVLPPTEAEPMAAPVFDLAAETLPALSEPADDVPAEPMVDEAQVTLAPEPVEHADPTVETTPAPAAEPMGEASLAPDHQPAHPSDPAVELEPVAPMAAPEPVAAIESEQQPGPAHVDPAPMVEQPAPPGLASADTSPEPQPDPEPAAALPDDSANKPAETGQVQHPVAGSEDGAGSVEPADDEPVR